MPPEAAGTPVTSAAPAGARFDYDRRIERAREALRRGGWSGLVATPGPNLRYLTGLALVPSERLTALVVPVTGAPVLVAPAFERDRLDRECAIALELSTWAEREDPFSIAESLFTGGGWLLDPLAPFWVAARFEDVGCRFRSAASLCSELRRCKEVGEVELLRDAQELTRSVLATVADTLAPEVRERDVVEEILARFRRAGAEGWGLVQFAEGTALPHGEPGSRALTEEAPVLVDLGAVVQGYHGDMTRSWWFGERPPPRYAQVAAAVEQAQARAADLARPGARAGDLDGEARSCLEERRLERYFVHRLGHGLGLEIHEAPFLVEGSRQAIRPGDVFTVEPGVYLPGEFGIRHEDAWVVFAGGSKKL